ncbi:MAG TPA: UDP-N-acetylmuramoyl-L-alanine--D-glutamate ligase [Candidatus Hydrogenedentes bacterium]|jgi:UDP-N-acetylmuramoylalanine--D-glutamate ligase|nr:UDP-N-acetylmuramoyl-L-alanine--D-glutamate ligase [Candidatus Hydrogenedentota bacterium]
MDLTGKHILLVGLGRSSVAAAQLIMEKGGMPFISERNDGQSLENWLEICRTRGIPVETAGHTSPLFQTADLVVINPGVPYNAPCLDIPKEKGIPVVGELEFASWFNHSTVIAVTGTNGKTTATSLLYTMIRTCGYSVALAGNTHTAWSEVTAKEEQPEYTVLEVSSYQMETADTFHPKVAVILNLTPDHLGRHGTMECYGATKARIFQRMQAGDTVILNKDYAALRALPLPFQAETVWFGKARDGDKTGWSYDTAHFYQDGEIAADAKDSPLPGLHNKENITAVLAAAHALGLDWGGVLQGLRQFAGVEHRIEYVASINGIAFFNDSKATNIDSLRVALESFVQPVVLIAGGEGKGSSYEPLRSLIRDHVSTLITIGEEAPALEACFQKDVFICRGTTMKDAVYKAYTAASPGSVVLLSPACASFDWYSNYEERGGDFKNCVHALKEDLHTGEEKGK